MSKRLVEIDDELLDQALRAAGTQTIRATVEAGLRRLVDYDLAIAHVKRLRRSGSLNQTAIEAVRHTRVPLND